MADPNLEEVPDFTGDDHAAIRTALRAANNENNDQVIERLTVAWQAGHDRRVTAWTERRATEQREAREAEQARQLQLRVEEQEAAEEAQRALEEADKKKPKMNVFAPGTAAPDILSLPPSQYALQKLSTFDYVELWYFSLPGRTDAAKYGNKSQADDTFGISKAGEHLAVRSIASVRASKNVIPDHDLSLVDFLQARNSFLDYAKKADWPRENLDSLSKFFWYLETHPLHQVPLGQKTVLTYASRVRHDWHRELKAGRGYDIAVINSRLLSTISDEVRANDEQQTKAQASILYPINPAPVLIFLFPFSFRITVTDRSYRVIARTPPLSLHSRTVAIAHHSRLVAHAPPRAIAASLHSR